MSKRLLEQKLAAYAMAGGVAALGLPAAAHASTIYNGSASFSITGAGSSASLDINGDSTNDFTFSISVGNGRTFMSVLPLGINAVAGSAGLVAMYTPGDLIDATAPFVTGSNDLASFKSGYIGNWASDGTPGYMGLSFDLSGSTYYGWARAGTDFSTTTLTVYDWAYNDQAGAGLEAGIPEPTTLGLFCLGAAGVLALRRRKRQAD